METKSNSKSYSTWIIVGLVIIVVLGVIVGVFLGFTKKKDNTFYTDSLEFTSFNLNYNTSTISPELDKNIINESKTILDSIITNINSNEKYTINLEFVELSNNIAGLADRENRIIKLNSNLSSYTRLNNETVNIKLPVLIHEILHILGIGSGGVWTGYINSESFYQGAEGIKQYKQLLQDRNYLYYNDINLVPVENQFSQGTYNSHFEEGLQGVTGNISSATQDELRVYNGVCYPSFPEEIMTGLLNNNDNYITRMTLGVLEDLGYTVNYNSPHVNNNIDYKY